MLSWLPDTESDRVAACHQTDEYKKAYQKRKVKSSSGTFATPLLAGASHLSLSGLRRVPGHAQQRHLAGLQRVRLTHLRPPGR